MPKGRPLALLQLPDACLLAVLQCLLGDPASLCSAARAHSKLHQAAVLALSSITVNVQTQHQLHDSLLPYLAKHSQYINSIHFHSSVPTYDAARAPSLRQLPPSLQINTLHFDNMRLQLVGSADGVEGLLGAPWLVSLKQLQLSECVLLGREQSLAAALSLLPGLQHLRIDSTQFSDGAYLSSRQTVCLEAEAVQQLQQLTYLELAGIQLHSAAQPDGPALQPLQALTRLVDLRLRPSGHHPHDYSISADMLSELQLLTHLELSGQVVLHPGALSGSTRLQHLNLSRCKLTGGTAAEGLLLSQLQDLQQLTHLDLSEGLLVVGDDTPPAAAFESLTASSMLHHLDISQCILPAGAWQHMFPAGRQLPRIRSLAAAGVFEPAGRRAVAPDGSLLASCCPGVSSLDLRGLQYSAELLAPLKGLSSLQALLLSSWYGGISRYLEALQPEVFVDRYGPGVTEAEGLLPHLTGLRQFTCLAFSRTAHDDKRENVWLTARVSAGTLLFILPLRTGTCLT
jgi:hypothetical protein